jgi:hypothetical protein
MNIDILIFPGKRFSKNPVRAVYCEKLSMLSEKESHEIDREGDRSGSRTFSGLASPMKK